MLDHKSLRLLRPWYFHMYKFEYVYQNDDSCSLNLHSITYSKENLMLHMYTLLLGIIKIIIPTLYTSISITDSKGNLILHLDSPKTGTFI